MNTLAFDTIKGYNKDTVFSTKFTMTTISLQDIKTHGAKAIPDGKIVYLVVNSKTKAVLVPPENYEMLVDALEELEDIRIIEERRGEPTIPLEKAFPRKKK